jgi:hypothetical protein
MDSRLKGYPLLRTFGGQIFVLTVVMGLLFLSALILIWWMPSSASAGIAAVFAGVCYVSAVAALLGESYFCRRQQGVSGMFFAMMIRTGFPLLAVIILKVWGGPFAQPATICYLIAFYFGALIVQVAASYCAAADLDLRQRKIP